MASARNASLYGGPWAESLVGVRGQSPPEAENSVAFGRPSDEANLHHFRNFAKSENHIYFLSYIPMHGFTAK